MADTSNIDLVSLIEQNAPTRFGKAAGTGTKRSQKGACPWCGGTDRFAVLVNEVPQHYHCGIHGNGCGAHGDAITFLREWLQLSYYEACEQLGVDPGSEYDGPKTRSDKADEPPVEKWQKKGMQFCVEARERLWSDIGIPARKWLQSRGLIEKTIKDAGLGLNLARGYQKADEWGTEEDVFVARGIVIPYRVHGNLWRVEVRKSDKDIEADKARGVKRSPKYLSISGGSNGLYGVDTILPDTPLVLCESVFDAMSFRQVVGSRVSIVATGSTGGSRGSKWVDIVKQSPIVLGAFDYDENGAGEKAFKFWHEQASVTRITPWSHDINDMLREGQDINAWIDTGLELASIVPAIETTQATDVETEEDSIFKCATCGLSADEAEDYFISLDGSKGYCGLHWVPEVAIKSHDEANQPVEPYEEVEEVRIRTSKEDILQMFNEALPGWQVEMLLCSADEYIASESLQIQRSNNAYHLAKVTKSVECLHNVPRSENKGHCKGKPIDGWCEKHIHGSEVMALGLSCDFVELQINEALIIGEGVYGWLAYAELSIPERLREIRRAIHRKKTALKAVEKIA